MLNQGDFTAFVREVEYARENVPFFQTRYDHQPFSALHGSSDINLVPTTTKRDYRKNYPKKILSRRYHHKNQALTRMQSSGTTGDRLVTLEVHFVYLKRAMVTMGVNKGFAPLYFKSKRRHCFLAAPNCSDVECANPHSTYEDRILPDGSLVLSVYHDLLSTPERILDQAIEELERYKPELYYVDATHLAFLCRHMAARGFTPPTAPVLCTYGPCSQISRRQITSVLGDVQFAELASMSELGFVALECSEGNLHLNNSSYYVEIVADDAPAEPGQIGELLVTTLDNGCTPHIRYRTGDLYTYTDERCPCGAKFPVVRIEGRLKDALTRPGTVVTPRQLDDAMGPAPWADLYKVVQKKDDLCVFRFLPSQRYEDGAERGVVGFLKEQLGSDLTVKVETANYLPSERSGKFSYCSSESRGV